MNVAMNVSVKAFVCSFLVCAVACGEDNGKTPVYTADVDAGADASVATLDDSQRQQLCASRSAFLQTNVNADVVVDALCLASAIIVGGTPEECNATYTRCRDNRGTGLGVGLDISLTGNDGSPSNLSTVACAQDLADCQASVRDLEACVNVNTDIVYTILDTLSCRSAGNPDTTQEAQRLKGAGVCTKVGTSCGDFGDPLL
jgi:hypothetical protein